MEHVGGNIDTPYTSASPYIMVSKAEQLSWDDIEKEIHTPRAFNSLLRRDPVLPRVKMHAGNSTIAARHFRRKWPGIFVQFF